MTCLIETDTTYKKYLSRFKSSILSEKEFNLIDLGYGFFLTYVTNNNQIVCVISNARSQIVAQFISLVINQIKQLESKINEEYSIKDMWLEIGLFINLKIDDSYNTTKQETHYLQNSLLNKAKYSKKLRAEENSLQNRSRSKTIFPYSPQNEKINIRKVYTRYNLLDLKNSFTNKRKSHIMVNHSDFKQKYSIGNISNQNFKEELLVSYEETSSYTSKKGFFILTFILSIIAIWGSVSFLKCGNFISPFC